MLTIYIDFKSAGSLLAIEPTLKLAERLNAPIHWRPYSTAERDTPDTGADRAVIESHRRVRLEAIRAEDVKYARLRGIDLSFPPEAGRCDLALGALAEIEGDRLPFVQAAFDAYWNKHANLDDDETVAKLIKSTGAGHSGDLSRSREAQLAAQSAAEEAGVVDAPAYIIDNQLFIGRQHLPWIEEIVSGIE